MASTSEIAGIKLELIMEKKDVTACPGHFRLFVAVYIMTPPRMVSDQPLQAPNLDQRPLLTAAAAAVTKFRRTFTLRTSVGIRTFGGSLTPSANLRGLGAGCCFWSW
jgi:hypothetical protein